MNASDSRYGCRDRWLTARMSAYIDVLRVSLERLLVILLVWGRKRQAPAA